MNSRRTQLVLLAAGTLIVAIASAAWWVSSPQGAARAGKAMVILVTLVCGLRQCRRLPTASPLVLCIALIGLGVVLFKERMGPMYPIAVVVVAVFAWIAAAIAMWPAARDRMSLRKTVLIQTPQHPPPANELCQSTAYGFSPDMRSRTASTASTAAVEY